MPFYLYSVTSPHKSLCLLVGPLEQNPGDVFQSLYRFTFEPVRWTVGSWVWVKEHITKEGTGITLWLRS